MRSIRHGVQAALVLVVLVGVSARASAPAPWRADCATRVNDTPAKAAECIRRESLWDHLKQFQKIADEHPNREGHPNRNTGTPGYRASVDYVAGLMRRAGYTVTVQPYRWRHSEAKGAPLFSVDGHTFRFGKDWVVGWLSGSGRVAALVQAAGNGCTADQFAGFVRGHIALVPHALCPQDRQVANAQAAGAAALILYKGKTQSGDPVVPRRTAAGYAQQSPARIPVVEIVSAAAGGGLANELVEGRAAAAANIDIQVRPRSDIDYNVIADSPFGNPDKVVVIDAHLDSIYGAGMLDNASGSTSILETALALARTRTANRLRYIWFGGEEIGLLGSKYYTRTLERKELKKIVFDVDVDVTATPNFDVLIADAKSTHDADKFPPNVLPRSRVGNRDFADYFRSAGVPSRPAWFGADGTDSNSFGLAGVPNSGILTQQDCCKHEWEVDIWGGYIGNYEGKVPGRNGGCVDYPRRWCDNLSNNDPFVLEFVSKAVAYVTLELANDRSLKH